MPPTVSLREAANFARGWGFSTFDAARAQGHTNPEENAAPWDRREQAASNRALTNAPQHAATRQLPSRPRNSPSWKARFEVSGDERVVHDSTFHL